MNNDFFGKNYELPKTGGLYMKLQDGDNLFRILARPILGWLDWTEDASGKRSPIRTPYSEPKPKAIDPKKSVKHFWAFPVWDYKDEAVKILEITQSTIQDAVYNLSLDTDWGDPTNYDINVKKTGKDLDTKYTIIAKPPKPLSKEIKDAFMEANPNLEALFENGDPFAKDDAPRETKRPDFLSSDEEPPREEIVIDKKPF